MKPIYTKFSGDTEKAKSLMPKARSRMKLLTLARGPFFAGVRIDRSLWDGVEITIHEYQDLYVVRIYAEPPGGRKFAQGGVWCIPIDDYNNPGVAPGGYDSLGEPIPDRLIPGPPPEFLVNDGDLWNPQGSWSYKTLEPSDSVRGNYGPYDPSVDVDVPATANTPQTLDGYAQFHLFPSYGIGRRGNAYTWHEPSETYLSWDMGWEDVTNIGFTQSDIDNGRISTHTDRYFGVPAGKQFYWNGHILGGTPSDSAEQLQGLGRGIIGAGIIGGGGAEDGLTVVAVLRDFTTLQYGTYLNQFNYIRKDIVTVWKRTFPGNAEPNFRWPDAPEDIDGSGGWVKIGDVEIPARWDLQSVVTNKNLTGDAYSSWYSRYYRFRGVAAFNEKPKLRIDETPIYEFSGSLAVTAGLERESDPVEGNFPVRLPFDQGTDLGEDWQFCGNNLTASFYTITLNEDLTGIDVTWEDTMLVPELNTLPELCSPWGIGFQPILEAVDQGDGWVRGAVDYSDQTGDKVYLEQRTLVDEANYIEYGQNQLHLGFFNHKMQIRWCGHSFNSTHNYYYDYGASTPPYDFDVDQTEFILLGLDMRRDRAWVCAYYAEKRTDGVDEPHYYYTSIGQNMSHYLIKGADETNPAEVVHMYNEIDGLQALGTYNLNGTIARPSAPFNTLQNEMSDPYGEDAPGGCTEIIAVTWIDNVHPYLLPMGINSHHNGDQGSNRAIRLPNGTRPILLPDAGRIQHSMVGFGVCHNGDVFCAKVASKYGYSGSGYDDSPDWTGVQFVIRAAVPNQERCIMWDSKNGLNSYVETFNMPTNDQDCQWLGVIG